MNVLLISTYELGRQPFGVASAASWLQDIGASVACLDVAVEAFDPLAVQRADFVAFYVPMHTATRLALQLLERTRALNPSAHVCFFGLYAPVNEGMLRRLGVDSVLGGEFENGLASLVERLMASGSDRAVGQEEPTLSLARQRFRVPDRSLLPSLEKYARLRLADGVERTVGYTEATRGCKHLCRHCPIVPVYNGRFRVVQRDIVLADIERQVAAGAEHITFGDPDFFNAPIHAAAVLREMHRSWSDLTYDVTIKVQHLLEQERYLGLLRETGCVVVTSAVESIDDEILAIFDKRHTRDDFVRAVELCRKAGLQLSPTFVTFTPWTSVAGYVELLTLIDELHLIGNVSPIQWAIRLLVPAGSRLLELPAVRRLVGGFDEGALSYPWVHADPRVDQLHGSILEIVRTGQSLAEDRWTIFERVWAAALAAGEPSVISRRSPGSQARPPSTVPYLTEPWYC